MKFRAIYMVEIYNGNYDVAVRRYARNRKVAERIRSKEWRGHKDYNGTIVKVPKRDWIHINPEWVE